MITGKCKAEFGSGDILITPVVKDDFSKGFIVLQNKGKHQIGEYTKAEEFTKEENDTVLSFTKTESVDVLIERLQKLKRMMNEELKEKEESDIVHADYEW